VGVANIETFKVDSGVIAAVFESTHPPRLRIQSAVPKNDSTKRAASAVSTAC